MFSPTDDDPPSLINSLYFRLLRKLYQSESRCLRERLRNSAVANLIGRSQSRDASGYPFIPPGTLFLSFFITRWVVKKSGSSKINGREFSSALISRFDEFPALFFSTTFFPPQIEIPLGVREFSPQELASADLPTFGTRCTTHVTLSPPNHVSAITVVHPYLLSPCSPPIANVILPRRARLSF